MALVACGGSKDDAPPPNAGAPPLTTTCPATHEAIGPACVPKFDTCAAHEVPRIGGGCIAVGVDACTAGTTTDGAGGCNASLPTCGAFEFALPGGTCAPVAPCDAPIPAGAIVVDKNINAAIAAASSGATLYLAAGEYAEDVVVDKPLTIVGRCPTMVTILGTGVAITLRAAATIKSLAVTGAGRGIFAEGVTATIDSVHAHDLGDIALGGRDKEGALVLSIKRALVERVADAGIATTGGIVTIDDAIIRDVKDGAGVLEGYGILASGSTSTMVAGDVRIQRVAIEKTAFAGIGIVGAKVAIANALVRDPGRLGIGTPAATPIPAPLTITDTIVEDSAGIGIVANRATTLDVQRTTIRRTKSTGLLVRDVGDASITATKVDGGAGRGITLDLSPSRVARTFVTNTALRDGQGCGICGFSNAGHKIALRDVVVRDSAYGGIGVDGPELTVTGAAIERNRALGMSLANTTAKISGVVVRDTVANDTGMRGDGALVSFTPGKTAKLTITDALFERNVRSGLALLAPAHVERVWIRDTVANSIGLGAGILSVAPTQHVKAIDVVVRSVVVERMIRAGMFFEMTNATVDGCAIRDVTTDERGGFGDGLALVAAEFSNGTTSFIVPSTAVVNRVLIERSVRAGISVFGSSLTLRSARLRCNTIDLDLEESFTDTGRNPVRVQDEGDNDCACAEGTTKACRSQSNGLRPIAARE
jgi:hypothetical protein